MNRQQEIDEVEKQLEELSKKLEVLTRAEDKVEFLHKGFAMNMYGYVGTAANPKWAGHKRALTFATEEITKKVDKITQQSYKIAQYVFQKEPDYVPDWYDNSLNKYYINYDTITKEYEYASRSFLMEGGVVYMPKHVAEQLVEDLNNGNYSID